MEKLRVILCPGAEDSVAGIKTWFVEAVESITVSQTILSTKLTLLQKRINQYCSSTSSVVVEAISFGAASHILSSSVRRAIVSST